ncbi:HAD superfamily phosphoserine phosphatase-like hydrolase/2,3-diketo-5-methylthio-1-phosphopentane phosphatase [Cytobacillus firmus]|uniref:HAD superfamily phosphoserine phosphatase-like hydrolase/2,3-diketo-5-methylthio-1-phosphopentane phosphatase n=2 Tax=Cytobacillus TaxID=2675230 RepID=A0A366K6V9_CYTFI|nr:MULTISPECIES: MtnX-like HAD-IB family phosphatase [Cytobacillus]RBP96341.1 HAD superfamily phosphoserine phosphatase-like hydrolase/2,3-diketo-5-methylthio-1-phosphopentane phosphatase [Cytobacillus firmus]TDX45933.1 HAD superfamily phosphoserine phosphatase-like hydrolase/2,3-diketo-5-methylthio-1-phosphopentane phosphatase [Cytobacillus oceanisediminis]
MKKWAFVSDFDGTISKRDFYLIMMDKYFPEGRELMSKWKAGEMKDIDFLNKVFTSINQEEDQIISDINSIEIDEYVPDFIEKIQQNGGDFYILSAGTNYYIYHLLKKFGVEHVKVFSNEGYYHEKNVHMKIDKDHQHYSERYGIDKSKVIQDLKKEYETVFFIGDSEPDSHPAEYADITFAKNGLQDLLWKKDISFVPVEEFSEVEVYLKEKGMLPKK